MVGFWLGVLCGIALSIAWFAITGDEDDESDFFDRDGEG